MKRRIVMTIVIIFQIFCFVYASLYITHAKSETIELVQASSIQTRSYIKGSIKEPTACVVSLGEFKLTAYCSCEKCCGYYATIRKTDENGNKIVNTASGTIAQQGRTIAVDTSVIPFGTRVLIDGNEYVAEDRGGAIKGNRIDIYFSNHQDALNFGVQYKTVSILA